MEHGLRLKKKCQLLKPSVDYLGYVVDAEGLRPMPEKVEAITKALRPENVKELRSFGSSSLTCQLSRSLSTRSWNRAGNGCGQPNVKGLSTRLKNALTSDHVVTHYDTDLPLKMDCDASTFNMTSRKQ